MRDAVGDLGAGGFDLALRFGEPPNGSLVARKLVETRALTVAAPVYVAEHGRPRHPSEVVDHDCIGFYDAANQRPFDWEFRKGKEILPVKVSARVLVSDVGAMLSACEAGAGIAQILQLGSSHLVESGALINLFPEWSGHVLRSMRCFHHASISPRKWRELHRLLPWVIARRMPETVPA